MKNLPLIFCGIFFVIAFSWSGLILSSQLQYGNLVQAPSVDGAAPQPQKPPGEAILGKAIYIREGCIYCHSQQVRPERQGGDIARGWGSRNTVARDYIFQERVLLGTMRTGPDLADIGTRQKSTEWHYNHLFDARLTSKGSTMPPFRFLFKQVPVAGGKPAPNAVKLPADYFPKNAPAAGFQYVPTEDAEALVQYLLSLKIDYDLPESKMKE